MRDAQDIFFEAIDLEPTERDSFLDEACGGDTDLRATVKRLLDRHENLGSFLERPLVQPAPATRQRIGDAPDQASSLETRTVIHDSGDSSRPAVPREFPAIPGYQILAGLGYGGMGVVYKALQVQANRVVALKTILFDGSDDSEQARRFRTEAEAMARLQHPGIVQIFEVGEYSGGPFFSMEYCPGGSLDRTLQGRPMPTRETARLGVALARAIEVAHRAQVLHRDLKPGNVLVRSVSDSGELEVKITDFGLAKQMDDDSRTRTGLAMGTPSYMPPEQARGDRNLGPGVDVYSIGAILYECLTGRPPFRAANSFETVRQVLETDPVSPRYLQPSVPRDLETICAKCLHKSAERRYLSAAELGDDLQRFLDGEPIQASPVGLWERTLKWVRRSPALASALGMALLALVVVLVGGVLFTMRLSEEVSRTKQAQDRAQAAEERATRRANEAEARLYGSLIQQAHRLWLDDEIPSARSILGKTPVSHRRWEYDYLHDLFETRGQRVLGRHSTAVQGVCWSGDGRYIVSFSQRDRENQGEVKVWDALQFVELYAIPSSGRVVDVAVHPSAGRVAVAKRGDVEVWDVRTRRLVHTLKKPCPELLEVEYSPDGKYLVTSGEGMRVWDASSHTLLHTVRIENFFVTEVRFTPDGSRIVGKVQGRPNKIYVWRAADASVVRTIEMRAGTSHLAVSSDGRQLAGGIVGEGLITWNLDDGAVVKRFPTPTYQEAIRFSPVGWGLTYNQGRAIRIRSHPLSKTEQVLRGHDDSVYDLAYSPDGKWLVSGSVDKTIRLWNLEANRDPMALRGRLPIPAMNVVQHSFASDVCPTKNLLAMAESSCLRLWNLEELLEVKVLSGAVGPASDVGFSRDGRYVAAGCPDGAVRVWEVETSKVVFEHRVGKLGVLAVRFEPDGKRLAICIGRRGQFIPSVERCEFRVFEVGSWQRVSSFEADVRQCASMDYTPDSKYLVTANEHSVALRDPVSGKVRRKLGTTSERVWDFAFSPKRDLLALPDRKGNVGIWNVATGARVADLEREGSDVLLSVAFSSDGERLVASLAHSVQLWETRHWSHLLTIARERQQHDVVHFSPDGRFLIGIDRGAVVLWGRVAALRRKK